jgi:hypothetical protein
LLKLDEQRVRAEFMVLGLSLDLVDEYRDLILMLEEQGPDIGGAIGEAAAGVITRVASSINVGDLFKNMRDLLRRIFADKAGIGGEFARINAEFDDLRANFDQLLAGPVFEKLPIMLKEFGIDVADSFEAVRLVREEIEKLRAQAIQNFVDNLLKPLIDFVNMGKVSKESPFAPEERLTEAQRQFQELFQRAMGGDIEAIQALPQAGQLLLDVAREFFASSEGFKDVFAFVQDAMNQVIANTTPGLLEGATLNDVTGLLDQMNAMTDTQIEVMATFADQNHVDMQVLTTQVALLRGDVKQSQNGGTAVGGSAA